MEGNSGFDADEDFYEDDEPVEQVMAAFSQGESFVTTRSVTVELTGPALPNPTSWRWPVRVVLHAAPATPIILARA